MNTKISENTKQNHKEFSADSYTIFEFKGHQYSFKKNGQLITVPFLKGKKPGEEILLGSIMKKGEQLGYPYIEKSEVRIVIKEHGIRRVRNVMRYKPKKRSHKNYGYGKQFTRVECYLA